MRLCSFAVATPLGPLRRIGMATPQGILDATAARTALLERRLPGQRLAVRRALAETLKPNLRRKGASDTHAALLRLARDRVGALRLVTTNFDRIFHVAARRERPPQSGGHLRQPEADEHCDREERGLEVEGEDARPRGH